MVKSESLLLLLLSSSGLELRLLEEADMEPISGSEKAKEVPPRVSFFMVISLHTGAVSTCSGAALVFLSSSLETRI